MRRYVASTILSSSILVGHKMEVETRPSPVCLLPPADLLQLHPIAISAVSIKGSCRPCLTSSGTSLPCVPQCSNGSRPHTHTHTHTHTYIYSNVLPTGKNREPSITKGNGRPKVACILRNLEWRLICDLQNFFFYLNLNRTPLLMITLTTCFSPVRTRVVLINK